MLASSSPVTLAPPAHRRRTACGLTLLAGFVLASWLPGASFASTVAEQRARLPPPADCKDPIAGIWKSHSYDERFRDWTIFTLEIKRTAPDKDEFEGKITNDSWDAEPHESSPPKCRGGLRYIISMPAKGYVRVSEARLWLGQGASGPKERRNEAEVLVLAPSLLAVSDTLG